MKYRDSEKARSQRILNDVIRAEGNGKFDGRRCEFVLDKSELNLWDGIREDALDYFRKDSIAWWSIKMEKHCRLIIFQSN